MVIGLAGLKQESNQYLAETNGKRPWLRGFARVIDGYIFFAIVPVLLYIISYLLIGESFLAKWQLESYLFNICIISLWIFLEALLLSTWGTTPCKALLRITVRNMDGTKLTFRQAFNRTFQLWFKELVYELKSPLFYKRLNKSDLTSWDAVGGWVVEAKPLGKKRITVLAVIVPSTIVIVSYFWALMKSATTLR